MTKLSDIAKNLLKEDESGVDGQKNKELTNYVDKTLKTHFGVTRRTDRQELAYYIQMLLDYALTAANWHKTARASIGVFPHAELSLDNLPAKYPTEEKLEFALMTMGDNHFGRKDTGIAKIADWDGVVIIDFFAYYAAMRLGNDYFDKINKLKSVEIYTDDPTEDGIQDEVFAEAKTLFTENIKRLNSVSHNGGIINEAYGLHPDALTSYIETALWSSTDTDDEPMDSKYDISDVGDEFKMKAKSDLSDFIKKAEEEGVLEAYLDAWEGRGAWGQLGHNFWLSRNGHGAGFFDDQNAEPEVQEKMQDIAETFGEAYLDIGHDDVVEEATVQKYRYEAGGVGEDTWSGNGMEYDTIEAAEKAAKNLASRWYGADIFRVVPLETPTGEPIDLDDPQIVINDRRR